MLRQLSLKHVGPAPELSLSFGRRLNVLTGDNGVGKSFILDVAAWVISGWWSTRPAVPNIEHSEEADIFFEIGTPSENTGSGHARYSLQEHEWSVPRLYPFPEGILIYAKVDGSYLVWDSIRNTIGALQLDGLGELQSDEYVKTGPNQPPEVVKVVPDTPFSVLAEKSPGLYKFINWWAFQDKRYGPPFFFEFSPDDVLKGLRASDETVICHGLMEDWAKWQSENGLAFKQLNALLSVLSHPSERMEIADLSKVFPNDQFLVPTLSLPYGNVPFPIASSAVKRISALAYLLVWAWTEHTAAAERGGREPTRTVTLIVDEPECHLHPKWQRTILPQFLEALDVFSNDFEVQLFCATHSPLVMASIESMFNQESDRLFVLELENNEVMVRTPPWVKHGDAVGWLTSDIFGRTQSRSVAAESVIAEAENFMRGKPGRAREDIEKDLARFLPDIDPFWPRWDLKGRA